MATALNAQSVLGPYPAVPVTATSLDFTFAAGDVTGNTFQATGRELLVVKNTAAGNGTFTITSVADHLGRKGDIGPYTVAGSNATSAFWVGNMDGWASSGVVTVTPSATTMQFAVLRIPN